MRKVTILLISFLTILPAFAQRENFSYKFYGFVRGDIYYNSRKNVEAMDGVFYMYPKGKDLDANGKDLNATPESNFYTFTTRLGVDVAGPRLGSAYSSAKVEADFAGMSGNTFVFRVRHAYVKLRWDSGSAVTLGQTWHPLFGEFYPDVVNLSPGTPFHPFNRNPQIRYTYDTGKFDFVAAAVYQLTTVGATGGNAKSGEYTKTGVIPELFVGINYKHKGFRGGIGIDMLSIKPRTSFEDANQNKYKVDERLTTFSYTANAQYKTGDLTVAAKTVLGANQTNTNMLGTFGTYKIDPVTHEHTYSASRYSTSWLNVVYGNKWKGGLFGGYMKNLGTNKELLSQSYYYGSGLNIDQMTTGMASLSYNLPFWKVGLEYSATTAWYGDLELKSGKVTNTSSVTNHRIMMMFAYTF